MPTYFARSTKVTLSVASLAKSTDTGSLTHRDTHTRKSLQTATSELSNGAVLKEMPIYTAQDGSHLRFLGEDNDMPFFMVRTGDFHLGSSTHGTSNEHSLRVLSRASSSASCDPVALLGSGSVFSSKVTSTPNLTLDLYSSLRSQKLEEERAVSIPVSADRKSYGQHRALSHASRLHSGLSPDPHALTLTVSLSKASFLRTYDRRLEKYTTQDVKIDVFYNGELCASTYVPERFRGYASSQTELIQRFSGRKIARLAQRPWILISPGKDDVGFLKTNRRSTDGASAKERWEALSSALRVESEQWGQNSSGELPVIGEYLASLAKLEMPTEVEGLQRSGGPNFGVLDVVIISGKGQKDDSSAPYLSEPARLRVKGYVPVTAADIRCDQKSANGPRKMPCSTSTVSVPRRRSRTNADAQITAQNVSPLKPRPHLATPGGSEGDMFDKPRAPSAAPSAVTQRRSSAVEATQTAERGAAEPKRTTSLYQTLMERFAGTTSDNSSVSNFRDPLYDSCLASARAETPRRSSLSAPVFTPQSGLPWYCERFTDIGSSGNYCAVGEVASSRAMRTRVNSPEDYSWLTRDTQQFRESSRITSSVGQVLSASPRRISGRKLFTFNTRHSVGEGDDNSTDSPRTAVSPSRTPHISEKRLRGHSPTEEQPKSKRARGAYHTVVNDKMTLAEEMAAIEAFSKDKCLDDRMMTTRSSFSSTASTTAPSTAPSGTPFSATPSSSFDFTEGKVNAGQFSGKRFTRSNSRGSFQLLPAENAPLGTPSTAGKSLKTLPAITRPPRRRRPTAPANDLAGAGTSHPLWPTPALSQDCVITYADGLTRQVKTERNGWFEEKSVLMGVRYLIG